MHSARFHDDAPWHPCFCVLVHPHGAAEPCPHYVRSHDEPFCVDCADRHPEAVRYGVLVRTRALTAPVGPAQPVNGP